MGRLTDRVVKAIVRTHLTEEQLLSAIQAAELQSDAPREKRKYKTRELRAEN